MECKILNRVNRLISTPKNKESSRLQNWVRKNVASIKANALRKCRQILSTVVTVVLYKKQNSSSTTVLHPVLKTAGRDHVLKNYKLRPVSNLQLPI